MSPDEGKTAVFHLDVLPDTRIAQKEFEVLFGKEGNRLYPTLTAFREAKREELTWKQLLKEYIIYTEHFNKSQGKLNLERLVRKKVSDLSKRGISINQCTCAGLGRFSIMDLPPTSEYKRKANEGLHQFVVLDFLVKILKLKGTDVIFQNPRINEVETSFIEACGRKIVLDEFAAREKMTQNTFLFLGGADVASIVAFMEIKPKIGLYLAPGDKMLNEVFLDYRESWGEAEYEYRVDVLRKYENVMNEEEIPTLNGASWELGTNLYWSK